MNQDPVLCAKILAHSTGSWVGILFCNISIMIGFRGKTQRNHSPQISGLKLDPRYWRKTNLWNLSQFLLQEQYLEHYKVPTSKCQTFSQYKCPWSYLPKTNGYRNNSCQGRRILRNELKKKKTFWIQIPR